MFNNASNKLDVSVKMADGSIINGSITAGLSAGLMGAVNKEQPFIEIADESGVKRCLGQAHIMSIEVKKPFEKPDAPSAKSANLNNAFTMLNLQPGCTPEAAKQRYHEMMKKYHPDKFQSVELPEEIKAYLADMSQQLGTAYQIINQELQKQHAA